ncbi:MAG: hypothetical protein JRN15_11125 [Nitrososphaerota archaeon]|nr:hypothetical protein [Nitrososphaerota archaeon]
MFCHITNNCRGGPLVRREVVLNSVGSMTTRAGRYIRSQLDENAYEAGIKVSDEELVDKNVQVIDSKWNESYS